MKTNQSENLDIEMLNLNFTPKPVKEKRVKALATSSDRNHTPHQNNSWTPKNDRALLIEKKKNYSDAIRERNMNTMNTKSKKKSQMVIDLRDPLHDPRINTEQKENNPHAHTTPIRTRIQSSLKKKVKFYGKRQSITVLDIDPIEKRNDDYEACKNQSFVSPEIYEEGCEFSGAIYDFGMKTKNLSFCSGIVKEKINYGGEDCLSEKLKTLLIQNNTLKKELGNYRKQNSLLHRQLEDSKSNHENIVENLSIIEARAKEALQLNIHSESRNQKAEIEEKNENSMDEIMKGMQEEVNQLRVVKSNLELKVYMAEKRIVQEVDMWKKKMAKQVSIWRQRCAKLRNENMKIKNYRDLTFSMDISQDD